MSTELLAQARAWIADDPDLETRTELESVVTRAESDDAAALDELRDRFGGLLEFGTAGLRGALGAGPARMNRVVVIRTAAGLTAYLQQKLGKPDVTVVIGYDARRNSDVFARDTAAVVLGAGGRAMILPHTLPTPVLAFMIRHLGADAGVMVTASHNPPQDNGYKVYLGDGSQIVAPADVEISDAISHFPRAADVPLAQDGWQTLDDDVVDDYLDAVVRVLRPDGPRDIRIVHTALHGVGSAVLRAAFERAGFPAPESVADQADPDPAFPTVAFPNPEEPGAIDHALDLAARTGADLVIANDPDADRCAVAVPRPGGWQMLRGDDVGALLGAYLLQRGVAPGAVFANSIVSSRLLAAMAKRGGVPHAETLTGFKWISRVPGLAYGYEEALGYCVDPAAVRDKDGISAALLIAEFAAQCKAEGTSLDGVLAELAATYGTHATDSFAVRVEDLSIIGDIMARLRAQPPEIVAGQEVCRIDDLSEGSAGLPPTEGLRYFLADQTRIIVRPSGTEPKLKVYLETIDADAPAARNRLAAVRSEFERLTTPS